MVMSGSCIKVNKDNSILYAIQELIEIVLCKHFQMRKLKKFLTAFNFIISEDIECIFQFCTSLILQVVKTPIWLRIYLFQPHSFFYAFKPFCMLLSINLFHIDLFSLGCTDYVRTSHLVFSSVTEFSSTSRFIRP